MSNNNNHQPSRSDRTPPKLPDNIDDATFASDLGSDAEWNGGDGCVSDEDALDLLQQPDDDVPDDSVHPFKWNNADEEMFVEDLRNPPADHSNVDAANKHTDRLSNSNSTSLSSQHHQDPNDMMPPPPRQYIPPKGSSSFPQTINPGEHNVRNDRIGVGGGGGDDDENEDDDEDDDEAEDEYDADEYGDQFAIIPGYRGVSSRTALAAPASDSQQSGSLSFMPPPPPPPQPNWADRPRDIGASSKAVHAPDSGHNSPSPARSRIARVGSDSGMSSQGGSIGSGSGLRLSTRTSSSTGSAQADESAERKVSILRVSGTGTGTGSGGINISNSRNSRQPQHIPQSHPQYPNQHALIHDTTSELSISDPDYQHNMLTMQARGTSGLVRSGSSASGASAASSQNQRQDVHSQRHVQSLSQDAHQHRLSTKSDVGIYDRQGSELSASSALGSERPVSSPPNPQDQQEMGANFQMEQEHYVTHDGTFIHQPQHAQYHHAHHALEDSHPYMTYQLYQPHQHHPQAQPHVYSPSYAVHPQADDNGMVFSDSDLNSAYHASAATSATATASTVHGYSSDGRSAIDASSPASAYSPSIGNPRNQGGFRAGPTNMFGKRGSASTMSSSGLQNMSILECVVEILKGATVFRRKNFIHALQATVWLTPDLRRLQFRTQVKKSNAGNNVTTIELEKVTRLRGSDCTINIEATGVKKPVELVFSTRDLSDIWFSGLSCLVPMNTNVKTRNSKVKTNARKTYNPLTDSWHKKPLTQRKRIKEFILLGSIGRGSFGKVKLAISEKDHRFYAVKVLPKSVLRKRMRSISMAFDQPGRDPSDSTITLNDVNEVVVLRDLDHENVMKLKDTYDDEARDSIFIIVEYLAKGPIMSSSKLTDASHILEDKARLAFVDVLCGLEYLHRNHVVHRDIKPDNLLQAGDETVKISDFGAAIRYSDEYVSEARKASGGLNAAGGVGPSSKGGRSTSRGGKSGIGGDGNNNGDEHEYQAQLYSNSNQNRSNNYSSYNPQYDGTTVGTPAFTAPELCLSDKKPECPAQCYSADIWSLGATLFYMLYGRAPFIAHSVFEMYDAICTRKLEFPESPPVSKHAQDLIKLMLEKKPEHRASVDMIIRSQWLKESSDVADKLMAMRTSLMSRPVQGHQFKQQQVQQQQHPKDCHSHHRQRRPISSGVASGPAADMGISREVRVSHDGSNADEESQPNMNAGNGGASSSTGQRFPQSKSLTNVNGTRLRPQR